MTRSHLVTLLGLLCTACSYPMAIEVSQRAGRVVLTFHECRSFFDTSDAEAEDVAIREYDPTSDTYGDWVCRADFGPTREWTYDAKLPDCQPLAPGKTYYVVAGGTQGRNASRIFKLTASGPIAIDKACP